jgi:hypothetical protein
MIFSSFVAAVEVPYWSRAMDELRLFHPAQQRSWIDAY